MQAEGGGGFREASSALSCPPAFAHAGALPRSPVSARGPWEFSEVSVHLSSEVFHYHPRPQLINPLLFFSSRNPHPIRCSAPLSDCEPLEGNSVTRVPRTKGERNRRCAQWGVAGGVPAGRAAEEKDAEQVGSRPVKQGERPKLF